MSSVEMKRTIDHFAFNVPMEKFETVVAWYLAALSPVKFEKVYESPGSVGIGPNKQTDFWITAEEGASTTSRFHIAFHGDGILSRCSVWLNWS